MLMALMNSSAQRTELIKLLTLEEKGPKAPEYDLWEGSFVLMVVGQVKID